MTNPLTTREDLFAVLTDQLRYAAELVEPANSEPESLQLPDRALSAGAVPVGKPINNTQVYVLDDWFNPQPVGVVGHVYVAGACLAQGYLNRPEQTAKAFIDNPFGAGKLYKTGDLARRMADDSLVFVGRADSQIKIAGQRVEIAEVEGQLRRLDGINQAVVTASSDLNEQSLTAWLVVDKPDEIVVTEIQQALEKRLTRRMIPKHFKVLDALPLTPNGKVDLQKLRAG